MKWLGNIVDNVGTALNLPEWGISELISGGKKTSNTGRVALDKSVAQPGKHVQLVGSSQSRDAFNKAMASDRGGSTGRGSVGGGGTSGSGGGGWGQDALIGGGGGGNGFVGGGVAYDPMAALQAQQTREAQGIKDRILGRRGEVDIILNEILGRVDNLLRDRKKVRDQQYGFDTEALIDSLKGSIPEIEKAFASLGLSNSTFVGDRRDDTNRQYQLSQGATDRALANDLAEYQQWANTEKSKARTAASDMRHTFDSIKRMTPNHMNLSDLQRSELDLNKGIGGFSEQKSRFTTSGDALRALNSIGSDYDFDQILNSFATTASSKADTGSGGAASQAVLDKIQGNDKKKRLTEKQINNPVGAATA